MAFTFVRGAGSTHEPATVNIRASGVVRPGMVVEFSRTAGQGVFPAGASTTFTGVFGICLDYAQGASDVEVRVLPIVQGQLYQADCTDAALTAQIGLRHALNADGVTVRNSSTDLLTAAGVFRPVAMTGLTTGSGKLIGYFETAPKMPASIVTNAF